MDGTGFVRPGQPVVRQVHGPATDLGHPTRDAGKHRVLPKLVGHPLLLGHVHHHPDAAGDLSVRIKGDSTALAHPADRAVRTRDPVLGVKLRSLGRRPGVLGEIARQVFRQHKAQEVLERAVELLWRNAEDFACRIGPENFPGLTVPGPAPHVPHALGVEQHRGLLMQ